MTEKFISEQIFAEILAAVRQRDRKKFESLIDPLFYPLSRRQKGLFLRELMAALEETKEWRGLRREWQLEKEGYSKVEITSLTDEAEHFSWENLDLAQPKGLSFSQPSRTTKKRKLGRDEKVEL